MRRRQATWSRDEAGTHRVNALRIAGADEEVVVAQARVAASLPQRVDLYFERSTWRRILCVTAQPPTKHRTIVSWACSYCRLFAQVVGHYGLRWVLFGKHRVSVLRRACRQRHCLRRALCRVCGILHANVLRGGAQAVRYGLFFACCCASSRATSTQALLAVAAERIQGVRFRAPTCIGNEAHASCCVLLRWASCMGLFVMPSSSAGEAKLRRQSSITAQRRWRCSVLALAPSATSLRGCTQRRLERARPPRTPPSQTEGSAAHLVQQCRQAISCLSARIQ